MGPVTRSFMIAHINTPRSMHYSKREASRLKALHPCDDTMSFVNNYTPPAGPNLPILPESEMYGPDPYDVNFAFPLHLGSLESERVRLTPFIPAIHAGAYWEGIEPHLTEIFRYFPITMPATLAEFLSYIEKYYRSNPEFIMFAIIDKTRRDETRPELGGSVAGVIALLRASVAQLMAEIGYVVILPDFQRTHVASNAVGILLEYCLQLPTASPPGLGLRRVHWTVHPDNTASKRLAQRLGFKHEGVLRWTWVLPQSRSSEGNPPREGDSYAPRGGLDTVYMGHCWDDWENGGREMTQRAIDRQMV